MRPSPTRPFGGIQRDRQDLQARQDARRTLWVELHNSANAKNQALSALQFLYREVLERDLELGGVIWA